MERALACVVLCLTVRLGESHRVERHGAAVRVMSMEVAAASGMESNSSRSRANPSGFELSLASHAQWGQTRTNDHTHTATHLRHTLFPTRSPSPTHGAALRWLLSELATATRLLIALSLSRSQRHRIAKG